MTQHFSKTNSKIPSSLTLGKNTKSKELYTKKLSTIELLHFFLAKV